MPPTSPPAADDKRAAATETLGAAQARQVSLDELDGEHRRLLVRAITRVLCTEPAELTYAQIIDGLPIGDVAFDVTTRPYAGHPINDAHEELCPGMLDKAREFRDGFSPDILTFDEPVSLKPARGRPHMAGGCWLLG